MAADCGKVKVGRVSKPRGVLGELRAVTLLDAPDIFHPPTQVTLRRRDSEALECEVEYVRLLAKGEIALKCRGVGTREEAARWEGAEVLLEASALPPPPSGGAYYFQLEGLRVVNTDGREIGSIKEILPVPQGEVFVVVDGDGKELLIPSAGDIVKEISLDRGVMVVDLLEGMEFE